MPQKIQSIDHAASSDLLRTAQPDTAEASAVATDDSTKAHPELLDYGPRPVSNPAQPDPAIYESMTSADKCSCSAPEEAFTLAPAVCFTR